MTSLSGPASSEANIPNDDEIAPMLPLAAYREQQKPKSFGPTVIARPSPPLCPYGSGSGPRSTSSSRSSSSAASMGTAEVQEISLRTAVGLICISLLFSAYVAWAIHGLLLGL
ncbi:hypothetical protein RAB80_017926 [Fusarium oxysporum f. sp. vasinfectum]|uniref:Uncharacterized protein n=1 Tax=Fusarium oxysporum f. sp. vasinfectum 25433 TaxID=1089449 RepID=X0KXU1_FUSOX|nr:hypothetical protein FOTG_17946 [Fusarium oxysporum f. sp. vasinfectum 25433]KAK2666809.1 hypothetical protein RAB80_017926 [Fusarium oxysporum f. sp. vasinfectum]